jgi:hypothetical protein
MVYDVCKRNSDERSFCISLEEKYDSLQQARCNVCMHRDEFDSGTGKLLLVKCNIYYMCLMFLSCSMLFLS